MGKVTGFAVTFTDWVRAGRPRRSDDWIAELFNEHCSKCPEYDPEAKNMPGPFGKKGICRACGCHVAGDNATLPNALTYPNKPCPLGKFGVNVQPDCTDWCDSLEETAVQLTEKPNWNKYDWLLEKTTICGGPMKFRYSRKTFY